MHTLTETLNAGLLLVQSGRDWDGGPPWADHGMSFGPWLFVPFVFWVVFGAFVAWIVVRLFPSRRDGGTGPANRRDPAEEILRERFARGGITPDEYRRSLRVLRGDLRDIDTPRDEREAR